LLRFSQVLVVGRPHLPSQLVALWAREASGDHIWEGVPWWMAAEVSASLIGYLWSLHGGIPGEGGGRALLETLRGARIPPDIGDALGIPVYDLLERWEREVRRTRASEAARALYRAKKGFLWTRYVFLLPFLDPGARAEFTGLHARVETGRGTLAMVEAMEGILAAAKAPVNPSPELIGRLEDRRKSLAVWLKACGKEGEARDAYRLGELRESSPAAYVEAYLELAAALGFSCTRVSSLLYESKVKT